MGVLEIYIGEFYSLERILEYAACITGALGRIFGLRLKQAA